MNWQAPEFDPSSIDAVLVTHGHIDHIGYLPRLVRLGFKGPIYATRPTVKIAEISLKDSAKQQEDEARRANREGYSKHTPALPFYDLSDVSETLKLFQEVNEGQYYTIEDIFKVIFEYNGHILGSTFIQIEVEGKMFVFSGDIGPKNDLLLYPPKKPTSADVILIESTYGGVVHPAEETLMPQLERVVNETITRGGSLFIPSFAVERTQLLMYMLWQLRKANKIPNIPMIIDSPMGADILKLFQTTQGWHKLQPADYEEMCACFHSSSHRTEPQIVIAGSGMLEGGRILDYLETRSTNKNDTLLFVGYQAEGTRGRKLLDGEKEIKIRGKILPFQMQIEKLDGISAHGDQNDLLDWLSDLKEKPEKIFIIHGEPEAAKAFQQKLLETKQWESEIPKLYENYSC